MDCKAGQLTCLVNYSISVDPGDTIDLSFTTVNVDSAYSLGEVYQLNAPASFNYNIAGRSGNFYWIADTASARKQPYITVFRASTNASGIDFKKDLTLLVSVNGGTTSTCPEPQDCPTSIENYVEPKNVFVVQPNPFIDKATVRFPEDIRNKNLQLELYDLSGKLVKRKKSTDQQFEISRQNLTAGLYLYCIKDRGKIISSGRIVIE